MILEHIVAHKRKELERRRRAMSQAELEAMGAGRPAPLDFAAALRGKGTRLIAEVKRASPSKGLLCPDMDPVDMACTYADNGAAAISVLTDSHFFQGDIEYLAQIRRAIGQDLPLLRKDFILDPYQVHEAYAYGADAILLIAAVLSSEQLGQLLEAVQGLGMTALVEVHDAEEIEQVRPHQPRIVGINNRNLRDFTVDLGTFGQLRPLLAPEIVTVAESGVHCGADVILLSQMGADAVLVGEALVTAADISRKVHELVSAGRSGTRG